jgi:hypothetical protein
MSPDVQAGSEDDACRPEQAALDLGSLLASVGLEALLAHQALRVEPRCWIFCFEALSSGMGAKAAHRR